MLVTQRLGKRASLVSEITKMDESWEVKKNIPKRAIEEIKEYVKEIDRFKQSKNIEAGGISLSTYKKAKLAIKWILNGIDDEFKKAYVHYGVTRLKTLKI